MELNINTAQMIATTIIAISAVLMGARWQLAKKKLHEVRLAIDTVDDAVDDDKVSNEEFRDIMNRLIAVANEDDIRQIIQKLRAALKY